MMSLTRTFDDLPTEIKVKVFSYLTKNDLLRSVSPVCHVWHKLAWDPSLWKELTLKWRCDVGTKCVFNRIPRLTSFCLKITSSQPKKEPPIKTVLEHLSEKCSSLREISLQNCQKLNWQALSNLVCSCSSVRSLKLFNTRIDGDALSVLSHWNELIDLSFVSCGKETGGGLRRLGGGNYPNLRAITIEKTTSICDRDFSEIIESYKDHLEYICIRKFGDFMKRTMESISKCSNLETLIITSCTWMTDSDFLKIKNLSNLKHLVCDINAEMITLRKLFQDGSLAKLLFLELKGNDWLSTDEVKGIVLNCPDLRHVNFSSCTCIGDSGVQWIVKHCPNLITLHLSDMALSGWCFDVDPLPMENLIHLDLNNCRYVKTEMSKDVIVRLSERNPHLEIRNPDGFILKNGITGSRKARERRVEIIRRNCQSVLQF